MLLVGCCEVFVDLCQDWFVVLCDVGFDLMVCMVWLVEGLLMYLLVEVQDWLFIQVGVVSVVGSWIVVEIVLVYGEEW